MAGTKRKGVSPNLVTYNNLVLPPVVPGAEVNDLCNKVDDFYKSYPHQHKKQKASDLIQGAFYAMRPECRSNTDWMSQAANSARDVLYPLLGTKTGSQNLIRIFNKYAVDKNNRDKAKNQDFVSTFTTLDRIYKRLSDVTHHGTDPKGFSSKEYEDFSEKDFEKLISDFTKILLKALSLQQIFTHTVIDLLIQRKRRTKALKAEVEFILDVNADAHQYFFAKVDESWLLWLWENGFLDKIKQKSEDPTRYSYRTPELNYLTRMAKRIPDKVVRVMLQVSISKDTFNPEVIDQFLRICSELPANQVARISKKILDDKWVPLMGLFNQHGFEFEKMFKTLANVKDYENLLILAKAVLSVRTKKEIKKYPGRSITDNPFYFSELSYTKVFRYLSLVEDSYKERALGILAQVFTEVIHADSRPAGTKNPFRINDNLFLADVDFFDLELRNKEGTSPREDKRELAATIKVLADKLIGGQCDKSDEVRRIFQEYIEPLPDSQSVWRLKLYVLSLCPKAFKTRIKIALFAIFKTPNYLGLTMGREYYTLLQKHFGTMTASDQRNYIQNTLKLFGDTTSNEEDIKERKRRGSQIFSVLNKYLAKTEREAILQAGFQIELNYRPALIIGPVTGGTVAPRGPISQTEFDGMPVTEIAEKLLTVWSPETLDKQNTHNDFLHPLNAEGAGNLLQNSISKRLQDFVQNAGLFFDPEKLDPHYTYAFLRGIENEVKNNKESVLRIDWKNLTSMLVGIKDSGESKPYVRTKQWKERYSSWLADWDAVHSMVATLIEELLREWNGVTVLELSKCRKEILSVIDYLFKYPDPEPKDEQPKTATMTRTSPGEKPLVTEPYMMAINSVRGKAFEAFIHFVYQDGKQFKEDSKVKIATDTKRLFEKVLGNEETKAIMFMFGRYLATFYYRDPKWLLGLLPKIFPTSDGKKLLYLASWEGYISNNLFKELFEDSEFQKLYMKGLSLRRSMDPVREFFKDPEEGIAVHLALAYAHYKDFGFNHPLFKAFWSKATEKQNSEFIRFIGQKYLSERNESPIKNEDEARKRFEPLWEWILDNCKHPKSLAEFGYWTRSGIHIFNPKWLAEHIKRTLEKTKGELDWDYGLQIIIVKLAEESPDNTLDILRWSLLEYGVREKNKERPIFYETDWVEAFRILYKNPKTKDDTYKLIDDLIREGGSQFWPLKEIIES